MDGIAQFRRFNRTVTQKIGALETRFLDRDRPLGASRVLFEVGERGIEIRELRERLGLDSGYASRLVKTLQDEGLLRIASSASDARVRDLTLTRAGLTELTRLNSRSDERAESILAQLSPAQRDTLIGAMSAVERMLTASSVTIEVESPTSPSAKRCIANYYEELSGRFDRGFKAAESISAEPNELTPPNGYFLVATLHGKPVGCGALKCHVEFAEIKRMWVAPTTRGLGIGRRILQRLEQIAEDNDIRLLRLETNRSLKEAQALYRANGYIEVKKFNDEPYAHHWFEKHLGRNSI